LFEIDPPLFTKQDQELFYINLGQAIRTARSKMKISQEQLAQQLKLSRVSIVNIEKGRQKVQVHTLLQIGKFLGISIDHLLNSSGEKIDKAIIKEINVEKVEDIKKIKEFVSMTLSKNLKN
jgi:transcriptional regulator with XRE-family HTH domain